ncbi:hypothetical protein [Desulfobotulus sp.]|uniref:hypothetical protein n=1 Tax=Desulfobotulus sp. TaxID=1940337 RepID=UPI002A36B001|nr:hypothetical protein [Desulfobotulus sp.]MDY0164637.1 hypothetical protein [Desulfobotulus sp.]
MHTVKQREAPGFSGLDLLSDLYEVCGQALEAARPSFKTPKVSKDFNDLNEGSLLQQARES